MYSNHHTLSECIHIYMFLRLFGLVCSFRIVEQMYIYLLHWSTQYTVCRVNIMCAALCCAWNERTFLFMENLDDVQFGFVISATHINVYRLIAIVSMITCNNEFHFMIAPLNFNQWISQSSKKNHTTLHENQLDRGKKGSTDKLMSTHRI